MKKTAALLLAVLLLTALRLTPTARADDAQKLLHYTTGYLGNSFAGGPKWVQNFNEQMLVLPDGTVYLPSFWDEAGREVGIYRDADVIGQFEHTHMRGGFAVAVGGGYAWYAHTAAREDQPEVKAGEARSEPTTNYFGVSRYTLGGKIAPFPGGKTPFKNMLVLREGKDDQKQVARALTTDGKQLFIADTAKNRVVIVDCATQKITKEFAVARPTRLAVSPDGRLWILSGGQLNERGFVLSGPPPVVLRREKDGRLARVSLPLPAGVWPTSLAFAPDGRLLVTDGGPRQQIYILDKTGTRLAKTIGEKGGIYTGPHPGQLGPLRFAGLTGANFDKNGRLYVSNNVPRGGTLLQSYDMAGSRPTLRWQLYSAEFVDVADADPTSNGRIAYTADGKYERQPDGNWAWTAQTLDPFRFSQDARRLFPGLQCATLVRRLDDTPFLFLRGMWQGQLGIYRVDGRAMAKPVALLSVGPLKDDATGWSAPGQPEKGRYFWHDDNNDGQMNAGEYTPTDGPDGEYWASTVDARGDIWQGGRDTGIWRWRFLGLDKNRIPKYAAKPEHTSMPEPFTDLLRTRYQPETDTMYLTGQTKEHPISGGEWGTAGTVVCRYDDWSKPTRTLRYQTVLPYEADKTFMASFDVAGDLFFVVDCKTATVLTYDNRDGKLLGVLKPGPEVHGESGWVDFRDGLNAHRLKNGDYQVFVEEDWKGKSLVYTLHDPLKATVAAR